MAWDRDYDSREICKHAFLFDFCPNGCMHEEEEEYYDPYFI